MKQYDAFTLTPSQLTTFLIDSMLGIGVLSLANSAALHAKQDGWLSPILGSIYPLYIVFLAILMSNRHPNEGITDLSKKYYGKFIGSILNLFLAATYIFFTCSILDGLSNVLMIYAVPYLSPFKIIALCILVVSYAASKNIEALSKMNRIVFYISFVLFFIPLPALLEGSFLNVKPGFQASVIDHAKAAKDTLFSYAGIELIFILYPFVKEKKKIKTASLKAVGFITVVYTWFTFVTFYYLGIYVIPKYEWSFLAVTDAVRIPVITNFRFFFIVIYILVMLRTISNNYYGSAFVLKELWNRPKLDRFVYFLAPIITFIAIKMDNEVNRRTTVDKVIGYVTVFNLIWITLMVILIYVKKKGCNNEQG